ncbi:hypothetical protein Hanom_Chr02g00126161 [Helianthus anomalus]
MLGQPTNPRTRPHKHVRKLSSFQYVFVIISNTITALQKYIHKSCLRANTTRTDPTHFDLYKIMTRFNNNCIDLVTIPSHPDSSILPPLLKRNRLLTCAYPN